MKKLLPEEGIKHFLEGEKEKQLVYASEKSKVRHNIPELVAKYGDGPPKFKFKTFLTMIYTFIQARKSYKAVKNNPEDYKIEAPHELIDDIFEYAKGIGALDIGFVKVEPKEIFKNSSILYKNAIIVTMKMKEEPINDAPSKDTGHEVHRTYKELGIIVNKIAKFLRKKGYGAQSNPAMGGDVNYSLLAEKAGLGAIGNHGLLISPGVGPRQRIAAVFTSIENLPVKPTNKHLWIKEFCKVCKRCIKECPSQAIFEEPQKDIYNSEKHIDYRKCAKSFSNMYGCSICIKECTFNKIEYQKIKSSFK